MCHPLEDTLFCVENLISPLCGEGVCQNHAIRRAQTDGSRPQGNNIYIYITYVVYTEDVRLLLCTEERLCSLHRECSVCSIVRGNTLSLSVQRRVCLYSISIMNNIVQILSLYRREIVFSTQGRECPLLYTEDDILHLCAEERVCLFSTQRMTYSISVQRRECASIVLVYQEYITTIVYTKGW